MARGTGIFFSCLKQWQQGVFPYWGKCSYSLIYVRDLVRGLILAAEKSEAAGKTYYLADSTVYTNDDIRSALSAALAVVPSACGCRGLFCRSLLRSFKNFRKKV